MQRLRLVLTLSMVLLLVLSAAPALAQADTDGDGIPDVRDKCPDVPGLKEYDGCPPPPPPIIDNDMDGVSDDIDFCLDNPGPIENGGCPLPPDDVPDVVQDSAPDVELQPLPELPIGPPCMVATLGHTPVNIRLMPWSTSSPVGAMDPYSIYPLNYLFDNPYGELWYGIPGGHVASWVTRTNGCRGLPRYSFAEDDDGDAEITLGMSIPLPNALSPGFNPDPPPTDGPKFPEELFPFPLPDPAPQIREHILLAHFGPDDVDPQAILIGLLLPAVNQAQEMANESGEEQTVLLLLGTDWFNPQPEPPPNLPGGWVSFNPQPDPPAGPSIFIAPGSDVMFNPQPEPPHPLIYLTVKILPVPDGEDPPPFETEMVALNLSGADMPEMCDGSVMPTGEAACLYMNDAGDVAMCAVGPAGDVYCLYGVTLPAVQ